jgi:hypothetical protein
MPLSVGVGLGVADGVCCCATPGLVDEIHVGVGLGLVDGVGCCATPDVDENHAGSCWQAPMIITIISPNRLRRMNCLHGGFDIILTLVVS